MAPRSYVTALGIAKHMTDAEIIKFHREVSRLARAAYGRQPRYQEAYKNSQPAAQRKISAARAKSSAGHSGGAASQSAP